MGLREAFECFIQRFLVGYQLHVYGWIDLGLTTLQPELEILILQKIANEQRFSNTPFITYD